MPFHITDVIYGWNSYPLIRPFLFLLDPEDAHNLTLKMLALGLGPHFTEKDDPLLKTKLFGLTFPNPIGLAAGLDKQAVAIDACMNFGFGTVELGGVTPKPQPGNPRPRMFRIAGAKALINRYGFNSVGMDVFAERLSAWRAKPGRTRHPVGVNIAKNKDTESDAVDYVAGFKKLAGLVDYVVVNISCPNVVGFCGMQERARIADLLKQVLAARAETAPGKPVLLKISPDLSGKQLEDVAAAIAEHPVQAVVLGNTSLSRPITIPHEIAKEAGGLSGAPIFDLSTQLLKDLYKLTKGKVPLIGCGGISSGEDAYAKIRAGASMVQLMTALVFEGPGVVRKIKRELADLLRRDGFTSVAAAVGVDAK